jgi:Holliday junction resolvasome RuvABC DNA-binding subunit
MEKMLSLLHMGFTEEEVSSAIDNFDQRATVQSWLTQFWQGE